MVTNFWWWDTESAIEKLRLELENTYNKQDFKRCYEVFNEIYELKTKKEHSKESELIMRSLMEMNINGFRPLFSDITNCLKGLIELCLASQQ